MTAFNSESLRIMLRVLLVEHLTQLRGDGDAIASALVRRDDLLGSTAEQQLAEQRRYLETIKVGVIMSYPTSETVLPCITLIEEASAQSAGGGTIAGIYRSRLEAIGDPENPTRYDLVEDVGGEWSRTLQVGIWETRPAASELLATIVENAVTLNKGRLTAVNGLDATISRSGFEPAPEMSPRTGWVPVIRVTISAERTVQRRHTGVAAQVMMGTPVFRSA